MGRNDDDPTKAFPGPNKDIPYRDPGYAEPARGSSPRAKPLMVLPQRSTKRLHQAGTPVLWAAEPWPSRKPAVFDARVGDVLTGNVELRATCVCGHSALVPADELRRRHEPTEHLKRLRFVCSQCQRFIALGDGVSMQWTEEM